MSAPKSETKEKSAGSTSSASEASKRPAPKAKEETAVEKKAKSDGLRVAAAREARPQAAEEPLPPGKTFDRGKVLLMTAIWVFCVALVESIVNACLIGVLNSGVAYVVIPFILDFLFIGAFLLLYLRGFGKNSRRSSSTSYISASFVIFANIVLIVCLIAYLLIIFSNEPSADLGLHILQYAIFPIVYAFNLPLFAMLYSYHSKKL